MDPDIRDARRQRMDIYDYAMQMEKDGEDLYRELAGKTANKGIKTILTMLADAEVRHYKLFQNMKQHDDVHVTESTVLKDVRNVFVRLREEGPIEVDVSHIELYKKAQDIEEMTRRFYVEKSTEVDASQREVFLAIAEEEKRHYFILDKMIDLVSRPSVWLENPEWYHLEDY
jgi:rubrerythrin